MSLFSPDRISKFKLKASLSKRSMEPLSFSLDAPSIATQRAKVLNTMSQRTLPFLQGLRSTAALVDIIKAQTSREVPPSEFYDLKIVILSNHGSPDYVRCSEIDVFDTENNKVNVYDITVDSDEQEVSPEILINGIFCSPYAINEWYCKWNGKPITITMTLSCCNKLDFVRIWNGTGNPDQNIKDIQISLGDRFITKATVPKDIGTNICIKAEEDIDLEFGKVRSMTRSGYFVKDDYGEIPNIGVLTLEIELYGPKGGTIGLNQLEIFNSKGRRIKLKGGGMELICSGAKHVFPLENLFKDNKHTSDCTEMWSAVLVDDRASLMISFKKKTTLSLIRIYNHNSCYPETMHQSSKARVLINGSPFWRGKLKEARGISKEITKHATNIFISDFPFNEKIIKYLDD
jgi:hypothetical protein